MRLAVVGAGWSGLSCAIDAMRAGHQVTVFEASRSVGGRARRIDDADGGPPLDNGQHILIGAYRETLAMMRRVGVDPETALLRMPLSLRFADGSGLALPRWPQPLDLIAGIAVARGWTLRDKHALVRTALRWRFSKFVCSPLATVAQLCADLPPRVMRELIEPLCVSALNTPVDLSSGQVFLRVIQDALFGEPGGADLLIPRVDLGELFPDAAVRRLTRDGASVRCGTRVRELHPYATGGWRIEGAGFDRVVLAVGASDAARLVRTALANGTGTGWTREDLARAEAWSLAAEGLRFESIATVYLAGATPLASPLVALRASAQAPAQFAFDRSRLGGPAGLLAMVVSACDRDRSVLQQQVLKQAQTELGQQHLSVVQTVVEKRATFACTAGLVRPAMQVGPGLLACGDYVDGPHPAYPATLEGAVRSGITAAAAVC